jgi:hypothetical protein
MTDINVAQALQDELAVALQEARGLNYETATSYAEPIVRYLQQQYGGDELYIPQPFMRRDVESILADRAAGMPLREILRKHSISRRTYYRILSQS